MKCACLMSCLLACSVVAIVVGPREATPRQLKSSGGDVTCNSYVDEATCEDCAVMYNTWNSSSPGEIYIFGSNVDNPVCLGGGCTQLIPPNINPSCTAN